MILPVLGYSRIFKPTIADAADVAVMQIAPAAGKPAPEDTTPMEAVPMDEPKKTQAVLIEKARPLMLGFALPTMVVNDVNAAFWNMPQRNIAITSGAMNDVARGIVNRIPLSTIVATKRLRWGPVLSMIHALSVPVRKPNP